MLNCNSPDLAATTHFVPHVLIEMENLHDRQFACAWLVKLVETQWVWRETLCDPAFEQLAQIWMGNLHVGDFGEFLVSSIWRPQHPRANFKSNVAVFDLETGDHFGAEFAILVQLGFFVLSGRFYHPSIPESVTNEAVQQAALKVASTAIGDRQD